MSRSVVLLAAVATAVAIAGFLGLRHVKPRDTSLGTVIAASPGREDYVIAAPGRVEPASEEIMIASQIAGRLESIPVNEGDRVARGQVVAVLSNTDYQARVASARAELKLREAMLRRTINGAREEERKEAREVLREAQAVLEHAGSERARMQSLFAKDEISRSEMARFEREYAVAQAREGAEQQRVAVIEAEAREEDRARAEGEVELAQARLEEANALLDKTIIRSPIAGVVLRKHRRAGESVTELTEVQPIVTVGDASVLRVRAEVDETDIGAVAVGQRAWVTASAFAGRKFWGSVVRIAASLGRKNIHTDDPAERMDTKVLEVLVELDHNQRLPTGLRVDTYLVANNRGAK